MTDPTIATFAPKDHYRDHERLKLLRWAMRTMSVVAAVLGLMVFVSIGPRLEVLISPVVTSFAITDISHNSDGSAAIRGTIFKALGRDHCVPVSVQAHTTDEAEPAKRVNIDFEPIANNSGWVTRPSGAQTFGPWLLYPPEPPIGPVFLITVTHHCHFLWNTTQTLYAGQSSDFFPD